MREYYFYFLKMFCPDFQHRARFLNKPEFGDVKEVLELAVNRGAVRWMVCSTSTIGSKEKAMCSEYSLHNCYPFLTLMLLSR